MTKLLHILFLSVFLASCSTSSDLPPKEEDLTQLTKEQRIERLQKQITAREKELHGDNFSLDYADFFSEPFFQGDITDKLYISYVYHFYDRSSGKLVVKVCTVYYGVDFEFTELLSRTTVSISILR